MVLFPRFISTNHVIKAYFFPTRSQLQEKKNLTLRFILHRSKSNLTSEDLNSRHDIITKDVDVRWTYGPYLLCPQHIFLSNPKTGARRRKRSSNGTREPDELPVAVDETNGFNVSNDKQDIDLNEEDEGNNEDHRDDYDEEEEYDNDDDYDEDEEEVDDVNVDPRQESSPRSFPIKCIVRVFPALSVGDISWTLKPIGRRRKLIRVKPNATNGGFNNDTVKVMPVGSQEDGEDERRVFVVDLAIMKSWVKRKRGSSKYLLDMTIEKNSRFATASIQIQWDGATLMSGRRTWIVSIVMAGLALIIS